VSRALTAWIACGVGGALVVLTLAGYVSSAGAPGDDVPTDPSIHVFVDEVCFSATPLGTNVSYSWHARGRTEGGVAYASYTIAYQSDNGSVRADPWWEGPPKSVLIGGPAHIIFQGESAPDDWSRWRLDVTYESVPLPHDLQSMTLWIRAFRTLDGTQWNQASKIVYTAHDGFVCDRSAAYLVLVGALAVVTAGVTVIYVHRRRMSKPSGTQTDGAIGAPSESGFFRAIRRLNSRHPKR